MVEFINKMMVKVKEMNVNKPVTYLAHRTKLRLAKKDGAKDLKRDLFEESITSNIEFNE